MVEKEESDETRAKFLEALEKKKKISSSRSSVGPNAGSKVGGAMGGLPPKGTQRKSGSA